MVYVYWTCAPASGIGRIDIVLGSEVLGKSGMNHDLYLT